MGIKIGQPVDTIPSKHGSRDDGKYGEIYKAIDELRKGQWLPVIFPTVKDAYNFRTTVATHRTRLMCGKQRKCVVYVRNKEK